MRRSPIVAALLLTLPQAISAHDSRATYLGNEGVLVTNGDTKILFDAFYAESFEGAYALVPHQLESAMMGGREPFDGVDAIFISHIHPDHFNSRKTIAYLRAHPDVRLYAGADVVGAIRAADVAAGDPLLKQIVAVHVAPGAAPARFEVDQLTIEAYPIPHGGGSPVPNYAYRVTLNAATTVMHLGDAAPEERHYVPYQRNFDQKTTHVAFAPFWMIEDESGQRVLRQRIKAARVVGIHLRSDARKRAEDLRSADKADVFVEPGETRQLPGEQR